MPVYLKNWFAKFWPAFVDYVSKVNWAPGHVQSLALLGGLKLEYVTTGVPTEEERRRYRKLREERREAKKAADRR